MPKEKNSDSAFEIKFFESVLPPRRELRRGVIEILGGLYTKAGRIPDGLEDGPAPRAAAAEESHRPLQSRVQLLLALCRRKAEWRSGLFSRRWRSRLQRPGLAWRRIRTWTD